MRLKCEKKGHFAMCCQTRGAGTFAKNRKLAKPPQRIQRIDEWDESSKHNESILVDDKVVLNIHGDENGQNTMTRKIIGNPFQTMIDSG